MLLYEGVRPADCYPDPLELDLSDERVLRAYENTKHVHMAVLRGVYDTAELRSHQLILEAVFEDPAVVHEVMVRSYQDLCLDIVTGQLDANPPELQLMNDLEQTFGSWQRCVRNAIAFTLGKPYWG